MNRRLAWILVLGLLAVAAPAFLFAADPPSSVQTDPHRTIDDDDAHDVPGIPVKTADAGGGDHGKDKGYGSAGRAQFEAPAPVPAPGVFPPALILVAGGFLIVLFPRPLRAVLGVAIPAAAVWYVFTQLQPGHTVTFGFLDYELHVVRVDRLSHIFGMIFALVGGIGGLYAFHNGDRRQQAAALLYNAGALGVTFAGDYFTLYAFWELMAIASTLLIWSRERPDSAAAGRRYVLVHLTGGSILLAGVLMHVAQTGSIAFDSFAPGSGGMAAWFILVGFAINAAIPPFGAWLPDSYPRATITGAVFCSALTTKTAVYAILRGFYGWEILVPAGVFMALFGVVYAMLSSNIRELLAYHIISQVGYMVAGIGLGTELALNGAVAHAVCHILYKAVLFMGAGAVVHTTGLEKMADMGGFLRRQRVIFVLYMVGGLSISGFPLLNGFVSKSMVTAAAHHLHNEWVFLLLMLASVGTFLSTSLKLPYSVWFGEDRGIQPKKAPWNMVAALAVGGFLCVLLGVRPGLLYRYLPFAVHWEPYTAAHLIEVIQLMAFTFFALYLFLPSLHAKRAICLDTDVVYRKPAPLFRAVFVGAVGAFFDRSQAAGEAVAAKLGAWLAKPTEDIPGALPRVPEDEPGYDEDRDRRPLGVSLTLTLLAFLVLAIWTLRAGMS